MDIIKPMTILIIEDDEYEINNFKNYMETRKDIKLIKTTNSSTEGIEYAKLYMPDAVILDLELHKGEGSGLDFLEKINELNLDFKPLIIVTTNISSNIIYNHIHELGVDFIFYKKQTNYNPEIVINSIVSLRKTLSNNKANSVQTTETPGDRQTRIKEKINREMDLIGISNHLKGRKYLFDAILYLVENNNKSNSVFYYLANKYKVANSSISRAMQTAINYAWRVSSIDDLMIHYKARINYETGVPTPTEFIYYYAERIRNYI